MAMPTATTPGGRAWPGSSRRAVCTVWHVEYGAVYAQAAFDNAALLNAHALLLGMDCGQAFSWLVRVVRVSHTTPVDRLAAEHNTIRHTNHKPCEDHR